MQKIIIIHHNHHQNQVSFV